MSTKPTFEDWFNPTDGFNGDKLAEQLLWNLTKDIDFTVPNIDFSDDKFNLPDDFFTKIKDGAKQLAVEDITSGVPHGTGAFDKIMASFSKHLEEEFCKNRITGAEYSKAYIALVQAAFSGAVQFLTARDQAYWQAIAGQLNAYNSLIQMEIAKVNAQLSIAQAQMTVHKTRAEYAVTKLSLATGDASYKNACETIEATRAQTAEDRTDGEVVKGTIGKQKDLYTQQITSYQRNDELKAAKVFSDAWISQKTIDEGLDPIENFTNDSVNSVMDVIKNKNGLE